jgi:hypothetical protein
MNEPRIIQVFQNVSMTNGHDGLVGIASAAGVKLKEIKHGEMVIFINERRDKMKVYAANDVLAYYRSPSGRIQMEMVQHIPNAFCGGQIDFKRALRTTLEDIFRKKGRKIEE